MNTERVIRFTAVVVTWFDKSGGNTYHSVRITRHSDGAMLYCPKTYGYGEHYKQTALAAMIKEKWIPSNYVGKTFMFERENNYPILWEVTEGTNKICIANGKEQ